jgi:hypothetical protein
MILSRRRILVVATIPQTTLRNPRGVPDRENSKIHSRWVFLQFLGLGGGVGCLGINPITSEPETGDPEGLDWMTFSGIIS